MYSEPVPAVEFGIPSALLRNWGEALVLLQGAEASGAAAPLGVGAVFACGCVNAPGTCKFKHETGIVQAE
eukprot:1975740-Rhodomonas_salina.1